MITRYSLILFSLVAFIVHHAAQGQHVSEQAWHGQEHPMRYRPEGQDFVIENGTRRFNRSLYGTNTGFRVETGDLPEFALYMPGMGGNLQFGLMTGNTSKWLIKAQRIQARYRPGTMLYEINDELLGDGTLYLTVLAASDREGILIKAVFKNVTTKIDLFCSYGGATGKRFSRDGDIGADPESVFYIKPEYCKDNRYAIQKNSFTLFYGSGKEKSDADLYEIKHFAGDESSTPAQQRHVTGILPTGSEIKLSDAAQQDSPRALLESKESDAPVMCSTLPVRSDTEIYYAILNPSSKKSGTTYDSLPVLFTNAERTRATIAGRVKLVTPDPYLNTLGGALSIAADAIWEDPSYLHGAVAWRMRLNAWRGASVADPLGWHDRAKKHFSSYAQSQLTSPATGPVVPDTVLHFARQQEKIGTSMFSSGYICRNPGGDFRAHHYDMNLVFIDQLLTHFNWTGDLDYVKEMWPVIKRHLAWEKRNFDSDDDGLYDAYCCIWASDALEYSNGGVTHSSAYNYRAFSVASQLAKIAGEDPTPYRMEAEKIMQAIQNNLWMPRLGWYAEFKDFSGKKLLHPSAALWTIYHAIDSDVPDAFKAYQSLRYVDTHIPHIPMQGAGIPPGNYYALSTTNWLPYTWSINNVVLAEMLHTSLAYWQGGRRDEAFTLWKSALLESMYRSASPGGFEQLSFYDAIRGELYRDFADPIGMAARTLVEGLFGINPRSLSDTVVIRPGFPKEWNSASLVIPDIKFDFNRTGNKDLYTIAPSFPKAKHITLRIQAPMQTVKSVKGNGTIMVWQMIHDALGEPMLEVTMPTTEQHLEIIWSGDVPDKPLFSTTQCSDEKFTVNFTKATVIDYFDPQQALEKPVAKKRSFEGNVTATTGAKTVFVKIQQGQFEWWTPVDFTVEQRVEISSPREQNAGSFELTIRNNGGLLKGKLSVNPGAKEFSSDLVLDEHTLKKITIPAAFLITGSNVVKFAASNGKIFEQTLIDWHVNVEGKTLWSQIDLSSFYNDEVTKIFKNKYLSPRPASATLQLPWQGIGNWCYPLVDPEIDDTGLRKIAGEKNEFSLAQGVPFSTPGQPGKKNVVFTSQWDNYPDSVVIPLTGKASHVYLLMAGSTNPMQSRLPNGEVTVRYTNNTTDRLILKNPETWWPIEQDYYTDGYAFDIDYPKPIRVHLKTGLITRKFADYKTIKGFSAQAIEGGAATVLDIPLDAGKELKSITVKTIANDVVIGLMSVTLARP